jgi:hypothetical protein
LKELELYFDDFATTENYDSASSCFNDINDLVLGDAEERKKAMAELAAKMKESFEKWTRQLAKTEQDAIEDAKADAKADAKTADDDDEESSKHSSDVKRASGDNTAKSDSKDDDEGMSDQTPPPVMMFFQPVSLDSMIQHVLNLTEYSTFSHIMRTKVRQRELFRMVQEKTARHVEDGPRRRRDLADRVNLCELFEELVDRICGLTPHQKALQDNIKKQMSVDDWAGLFKPGE